jgi:hypothetical protein
MKGVEDMIKTKRTLICCVLLFLVSGLVTVIADEYTENLQSIVLEDFELTAEGKPKRQWTVVPDRFGREGNIDAGKSLQRMTYVNAWPEAYFGREGVFDNGMEVREYKSSMALYLSWNRKGYNSVDIFPLELDPATNKYVKKPIPFRGRVVEVDFWCWAANYDYELEIVLQDYRGVEHRLPVGTIKHIGWKNMKIQIPSYIPQSVTYIPRTKTLSLMKIVLWTRPTERVSGAYVYLDHIKYLADIFDSKYDGYELGDPEAAKNLWDKGASAVDESQIVQ